MRKSLKIYYLLRMVSARSIKNLLMSSREKTLKITSITLSRKVKSLLRTTNKGKMSSKRSRLPRERLSKRHLKLIQRMLNIHLYTLKLKLKQVKRLKNNQAQTPNQAVAPTVKAVMKKSQRKNLLQNLNLLKNQQLQPNQLSKRLPQPPNPWNSQPKRPSFPTLNPKNILKAPPLPQAQIQIPPTWTKKKLRLPLPPEKEKRSKLSPKSHLTP